MRVSVCTSVRARTHAQSIHLVPPPLRFREAFPQRPALTQPWRKADLTVSLCHTEAVVSERMAEESNEEANGMELQRGWGGGVRRREERWGR